MRRSKLNLLIDVLTLVVMLAMTATGLVIRYVLPPGTGGHGGGRGLLLWGLDRHGWGGLHFWLALALVVLLLVHVVLHWSWVMGVIRGRGGRRRGWASGLGFLALLVLLLGAFYWLSESSVETVMSPEARADLRRGTANPDAPSVGAAVCRPDQTGGRCAPSNSADLLWSGNGRGRERGYGRGNGRGRENGRGYGRGRGDGRGYGRGYGNGRGYGRQQIRGYMTLGEAAKQSGLSTDKLKALLRLPADTSNQERLGRLSRRYGFSLSDLPRGTASAGSN